MQPDDLDDLTQAVTRNVRRLRWARNWTAQEVSERCANAGVPMPRNVLANLESGRRAHLTVPELAALAAVFRVEPWSLTTDQPLCLVCRNNAPAGFACLVCGQGRPGGGIPDAAR